MRVILIKKKTLLLAGAILLLAILGVILLLAGRNEDGAETMALSAPEEYELQVLAGKQRELPVYSVEREDRAIALTIDAAWEADKTDFILKTLDQYGIKATFFLCGVWVEAYPEHVRSIAEKGHEIGNHSLSHPHMNSLDAGKIEEEIRLLDDEIEKLTGKRCTLFRAPFGEYNDTVIKAVRALGYEPIQWDLDTIDWKKGRSTETILSAVLPKLHDGCIILCHNNGYEIMEYLPRLIEAALADGYQFVTVSELLLDGETTIDSNGVMRIR